MHGEHLAALSESSELLKLQPSESTWTVAATLPACQVGCWPAGWCLLCSLHELAGFYALQAYTI